MKKTITPALALAAAAQPALAATQLDIQQLSAFTTANGARTGSAEVISYTQDQATVASTMSGPSGTGVQVLTLSGAGTLSERGIVTFDSAFGAPANLGGATSTAVDPLGRGFGVVTLLPTANGTTAGKIGFYNYRTGELTALNTLDVGFHPDSVKFSADGSKLYVVNEGEFTSGGATDAPGSLSIIDLSGVSTAADVGSLTNSSVSTFDFQAGNLGAGVSLSGLRFNDRSAGALANPYRHVEPEFVTERDGKLFVSLQENNAIATFDLAQNKWTDINSLGTITQTIDASDRDGPGGTASAQVNDLVAGMPMPDTIASFELNGVNYVVTANEGDFRVDDADRVRVSGMPTSGTGSVDAATAAALNAAYGGNYRAAGALGRLRVSTFDGDTNGDGDIDVLTMAGTRSFSVWNADTGQLVTDSGSLETLLLGLDPTRHNINAETMVQALDARSPDKGPEPEALVLGEVAGHRIMFLGLERQNGLTAWLLDDPNTPQFLDYINSFASGLYAPETLILIAAANSPTGQDLLLGGYEINGGGIGVYGFTVVPVPAALPLLGSAVAFLGFLRRRANRATAAAA